MFSNSSYLLDSSFPINSLNFFQLVTLIWFKPGLYEFIFSRPIALVTYEDLFVLNWDFSFIFFIGFSFSGLELSPLIL